MPITSPFTAGPLVATVDTCIRAVHADEEQDWNRARLASAIVEPDYRVWLYRTPALVLGPRQARSFDWRLPQVPLAVRESGGGAVLVGPWLVGMSVSLPASHPLLSPSVIESYRWFGQMHARVLRNLGILTSVVVARLRVIDGFEDCRNAPRDEARDGGLAWACFGSLSPWEVTASGGRKIVGIAQVRRRTGALLVSGTLVTSPDWRTLALAMGRPAHDADALAARTTHCEAEAGHDVTAMVASELDGALRASL